jgi:hypothetical protein
MAALLLATCLSGCMLRGYVPPEKLSYARLAFPYANTHLKTSTTLDVLNTAHAPDYQFDPDHVEEVLLTQSDTIIAFSGRSADKLKSWVNMVVFDEYRLTAKRKYFFLVDERAEIAPTPKRHYLIPPRKGILFDAEFVVDPEILTTPYATEEAQKVATIHWLSEQLRNDVMALTGDPAAPARGSATISTAGMMMGQTFTGLLIELDKSPGLAQNLAAERGIEFPHINLNKGRVRMLVRDDLATMTIRVNLPLAPPPTQ